MSFSQALSGLAAQQQNIQVISNNIANSQTVGFKASGLSFADVYAGRTSRVGLGVTVASVMQNFEAGSLENTGRNLDLAVAGAGFYRLEQPNGEVVYSRNGQFNQDNQGYIVNQNGQYLTGYTLSDPADAFSEVVAGGAPDRIRIPLDDMPPAATTEANAIYNLDASTVVGEGLQSATIGTDPTDPTATVNIDFHFSTSFSVYDSLGNSHTVTTYYTRTVDDATPSQWEAVVTLDGINVEDGDPSYTVNFDADGKLSDPDTDGNDAITDTGAPADGTIPPGAGDNATGQVQLEFDPEDYGFPDAATLTYTFDLTGTTQFNSNSVQNTLEQNGYTSGSLVGLEVEDDGTIMRIYTNEQRVEAGQIVLTNFINPEGLQPDGANAWRQSNASGEPILGVAGTGTFGTIEAGVLEGSNVNLAEELVNLIVAQRAYQANSSSIGTQDEMLQTVINL